MIKLFSEIRFSINSSKRLHTTRIMHVTYTRLCARFFMQHVQFAFFCIENDEDNKNDRDNNFV